METTTTLPYLVELTDEMKTKACIIEDIVKFGTLTGKRLPNWDDFIYLYDKSVLELDEFQREYITIFRLAEFVREIKKY